MNRWISAISVVTAVLLFSLPGRPVAQGEEWWTSPPKESALFTQQSLKNGNMYIDWEQGKVVVEGIGVASPKPGLSQADLEARAITAAKLVAQRNFLEATKSIYLHFSTMAANGELVEDMIKTKGEGYLRNVRMVRDPVLDYKEDGSVMAHVWVGNELRDITAPSYNRIIESDKAYRKANKIVDFPREKVEPAKELYTGLIVDCRRKKARPSLTPRIVDEDGREIYGSLKVDRLWVLNHGLAGYAKDVASAKERQKDRIGENPLVVPALIMSGENKDVAVVSNDDAEKIVAADKATGFLKKCAVVFVVD